MAGLSTAVANMIIMTFGYVFHTIMSGVINTMGGATSSQALFFGVWVIPIACVLGCGGFVLLFIQERKNKPTQAAQA